MLNDYIYDHNRDSLASGLSEEERGILRLKPQNLTGEENDFNATYGTKFSVDLDFEADPKPYEGFTQHPNQVNFKDTTEERKEQQLDTEEDIDE